VANSGLEALASELGNLKSQGHTTVALDPLNSYVERLLASDKAADPELNRQRIRAQFEVELEQYKAQHEFHREMFKAVLEAGLSALRMLSVINGAAAIAVLAFLGNVLGKGDAPHALSVSGMGAAMVIFSVGVGLVGLGIAMRYFSQATYARDFWPAEDDATRWGNYFKYAAIACAIMSLLAFFVGVTTAYEAIV
jgi:hypothetical protein